MIEIIAELSGAHGGSLGHALKLIEAAALSGATGVKFQCFDPERLAARRVKHPRIKAITWPGKPDYYDDVVIQPSLAMLYRDTHTPGHWFPTLISAALHCGLTWHASVFDPEDVAFLEGLDCPRYKIASFEAGDDDIRKAVDRTHKPVIMSANQNENVFPLRDDTLILHATNYGVGPDDANLARLRHWARDRAKFGSLHFPWGLSDHTTDHLAANIAAALGAKMIEWHIRLPDVSTPDDKFAWSPTVFAQKIADVRTIEGALK